MLLIWIIAQKPSYPLNHLNFAAKANYCQLLPVIANVSLVNQEPAIFPVFVFCENKITLLSELITFGNENI